MSAFQRTQRRFVATGVQLTRPMDACDPGKWPVLENVRSVVAGSLQARDGLIVVDGASFGDPIHTITRFDDTSPFADESQLYVVGAGNAVYMGVPGSGSFPSVDSGYSGDPLSLVALTPPQSPQPYLYIGDVDRMRKIGSDGVDYQIGLTAPIAEPGMALQQLGVTIVDQFTEALWTNVGSTTSGLAIVFRVNTTLSSILYDTGSAPGYASIAPASMTGINDGMLLGLGVPFETVAVTETTIAVASTTIAAIIYDSGSTGLCTIQPAASLGTGQLDAPSISDYQQRYGGPYAVLRGTELPGPNVGLPYAKHARIRQLDFPVNCLITIGSELVRILSVAVGKDGVQSFRCSTASTHGAGEAIVGVAAFRAWVNGTYTAGAGIVDSATKNVITPVVPDPLPANAVIQSTAGIRSPAGWSPKNLAQISGRATLPDDDVRLSIRADLCTHVNTVRIYFSLEPTAGTAPSVTDDFTANYFFFEWRQSDIVAAIQAQNADDVSAIQAARQIAQQNAVTNEPLASHALGSNIRLAQFRADESGQVSSTGERLRRPPAADVTADALSTQLALGNNQWLELHCKVRDLVHVGTDASKTLANVTAAEVLVNVLGEGAVTVSYDAIWISGGFGPDVGSLGNPYVYRYRYRSSLTGGKSNPSPPTRGGVIPRRQSVVVTGVQSGDPQVDLVDWFRFGGALSDWTYAGTTANSATPTFTDVYADTGLVGGDTLEYDNFPPFPTEDLAHTGTCNVAGSAIQRIGGDGFDVNWAPGSLIVVNGQAYTLYTNPVSTSLLFINENAGNASGVPFALPGPTLLGQNFASLWGGSISGPVFLFACRNPIDPGMVNWSKGNDPEAASDKNTLQITTPAEPLQAGFMWDGTPFVASTENLYVLEPTLNPAEPFRPQITPCGRGFWTPWAWCIAPEGIYFLAKDGIFLTAGGSPAISITEADLAPLFPHDGVPGQPVNGFFPVNMGSVSFTSGTFCADFTCTVPTLFPDLRLAYIDGWVKFDYADTAGVRRSLSYHVATKSWWPDVSTPGINVQEAGAGQLIHEGLIGGTDGQLYVRGGLTDNGTPFTATWTFVDNQQDARRFKLYRDLFLKGNLSGTVAQIAVSVTDQQTAIPTATLTGLSGVNDYLVDTVPRTGIFGTNLTVTGTWTPASQVNPIWEAWDIAYQPAPELASSWLSGPTTHGQRGYQQVPRALICYLSTGPVTLSVIVDGTTYTYSLPTTNGLYAKNQVVLESKKGKTFQWGMQGDAFLLFDQDCEVWLSVWGQPGGYQIVRPF